MPELFSFETNSFKSIVYLIQVQNVIVALADLPFGVNLDNRKRLGINFI